MLELLEIDPSSDIYDLYMQKRRRAIIFGVSGGILCTVAGTIALIAIFDEFFNILTLSGLEEENYAMIGSASIINGVGLSFVVISIVNGVRAKRIRTGQDTY